MKRAAVAVLTALMILFSAGCNENIPGDPDYYSCQFFGDHCDK